MREEVSVGACKVTQVVSALCVVYNPLIISEV